MLTRYNPRCTVSLLLGLTFKKPKQFECPFKILLLSKFPECEALVKMERLMSKIWRFFLCFLRFCRGVLACCTEGAFSKQHTGFGSTVISNGVYVRLYTGSGEDIIGYYVFFNVLSDSRSLPNSRLFY